MVAFGRRRAPAGGEIPDGSCRNRGQVDRFKEKGAEMDEVYIGVKNWWSFLIRGIVAIAVGVILLLWPASTLRVLAMLIGILALLDGVVETVWALVLLSRKEKMGLVLARGLVSLLIGLLLLIRTGFAFALVVVLIAVWEIVTGFVEIAASFEMPPDSGRGLLGVSGALSIALGMLLLILPLETVYAIIVVLSIFLFVSGVVRIIEAFYALRLRKEIVES